MLRVADILAVIVVSIALGVTSVNAAFVSIMTPSRNIGCIATNESAWHLRCDIREHSYVPPRRPSVCAEDYGDSFTLTRGAPARWTCHGDTALPPANGKGFRTVAYGRLWSWGPFTCRSRTTGLTCQSRHGYGFTLSRQRAVGTGRR